MLSIKKEFAESMDARIKSIEFHLNQIIEEAHKLSGSAPMFGFEELGNASLAIEEHLLQLDIVKNWINQLYCTRNFET